jgi:hypothetical protein
MIEQPETEKSLAKKNYYVKKGGNGGAREGAGRPAFEPTAEDRKQVEAMSGYGLPHSYIAALIGDGICLDTLRKHFPDELQKGKAKANLKVGQTLFQKAIGGDVGAAIWWSKTQMGWRESVQLDNVSSDGTMSPKSELTVRIIDTAGDE